MAAPVLSEEREASEKWKTSSGLLRAGLRHEGGSRNCLPCRFGQHQANWNFPMKTQQWEINTNWWWLKNARLSVNTEQERNEHKTASTETLNLEKVIQSGGAGKCNNKFVVFSPL